MRVKGAIVWSFFWALALGVAVLPALLQADEIAKPKPDAKTLRSYLFNVFEKDDDASDEALDPSLNSYQVYFSNGFQPKKFWSDKKVSFGYGKNADGDVIVVAWLNSKDEEAITLGDAKEIFLDGLFAAIKNESQLSEWQVIRKDVAGALINLRMSEAKAEFPDGGILNPSERLEKRAIGYNPFVVMIESTPSKTLLSAAKAKETD